MPNTNTLEEAIRDAGEGWLIDMYAPPEQAIPHIRQMSMHWQNIRSAKTH